MTYKLAGKHAASAPKRLAGTDIKRIYKTSGGTVTGIPLDPENTDYQEYLEWVAAGNTAEAAD